MVGGGGDWNNYWKTQISILPTSRVPKPSKYVVPLSIQQERDELDLHKSGNELSLNLYKSGNELSLDLHKLW